VRKFAKTLAVVGVLTPAGVNALGVGDIKLHSALNQKLIAEIPLLTSPGEDISQIKVRLAPSGAFARAGLDRPYYLSNLRFKPVHRSDGSVVIQVTSNNAIREPFLDFLLEVDWPQGRMLREFTVLLDPPITFADEVNVAQSIPGVTPSDVGHSRSAANTMTGGLGGVAYGPVKRNESLWSIAERLKQNHSVTTEQMVMALYRENPDAFLNSNVNMLKAGATLKIPSQEILSQLSPSQARRELREQYQAWLARKASEGQTQSGQAENLAKSDKPQLKLEAPEKEALDPGQAEMPIIEGPDNVAPQTQEEIVNLQAENEALRTRLEALEKQMAALLELKNAQLAAIQSKQQEVDAAAGVPLSESTVSAHQPIPAGVQKDQKVSEKTGKVEAQKVPSKTKDQPTKISTKEAEPSLLHGIFDDPMYLGMGGGSLFLLGIAGWMIWRRRQEAGMQADSLLADMDEDELELSKQTNTSEPVPGSISSTSGVEVAESSFLSEFTPSDFDILETENDAVDPIAEADVYLAYGRYQQAEELIKQALADEPERPELRLKLLEIYYANEAVPEFEAYAQELLEMGAKDDVEFWGKVVEMGRDICPHSSLFASASQPDSDETSSHPAEALAAMDLPSIEAGSLDLSDEQSSQQEDPFNLDLDQVDEPDEANEKSLGSEFPGVDSSDEEIANEADLALDFDLSDLNLDSDNEDEQQEVRAEEETHDNTLEFNSFSRELPEVAEENNSAAADPIDQEDLDLSAEEFDLTDMDELDTKLDLARAYVEMEDVDAARDILEEILEQGDENQKQDAQTLLDKLRLAS